MAVTYAADVKNARMDAVLAEIGNGAKIVIGTAGMASTLATLTLPTPSGTVSGDVLTLDMDPDVSATASGTGTAAAATITTSADVVKISGLTVGTSGTDIVLDSVSITSGQTVTLATGTITHA
jgi:hypothetical protein